VKNRSIYRIRDEAIGSGRSVFTTQEFANLTGIKKAHVAVYLSRMAQKGLAVKLMKGKFSFSDNDLVIATQLQEPSYVSLDSALLFHGIRDQIPVNVQCVSTRNSIVFRNLGIEYHRISPQLLFGYRRYELERSYTLVAEPEKALIDGFYLNIYSLDDLMEYSNRMNFQPLFDQLMHFSGRGSRKMKGVIALLKKNRS
jgi:predicted transcriptional regulator of viral defense system